MEDCGCYCEPPVAQHVGVPITISTSPHVESRGMSIGLAGCWGCGPSFVDLAILWVFLLVIFSPFKIIRALSGNVSSFQNDRYLSFAAIADGSLAPSKIPLRRLRAVLPMTRSLLRTGISFQQKTTLLQCAYCKDPPLPYHAEIGCAECGAFHHAACYLYHGGCSVFGCTSFRKILS